MTQAQDPNGPGGPVREGNVLSGTVHGNAIQAGQITTVNLYAAPDTADPVRPRQLPADVRTFVNQSAALAATDAHLRTAPRPGSTPVAVITGGPGVGKTALATRWAHGASEHYVHGQLFLRFDAQERTPSDMIEGLLRQALRALHVADELHPSKTADLVALYRTVTAPLSLLIVLDDAGLDAEVKPLIPASPASAVVVTSQHRLGELEADGAEIITLAPLETAAAVRLLGSIAGPGRVEREPEQAVRLVELCGRLPVAIRVLAARIAATRERPLARFVDALEDPRTRLTRLSPGGPRSMAHVFDEAVRGFDARLRRAYALLAEHPGTSFDRWCAAALLDGGEDEAEELLDLLAHANMLEADGERFRFNSLVRAHAASLASSDLLPGEVRAGRDRLIEYYRVQAYRADWHAFGPRLRLGSGEIDASWRQLPGPRFRTPREALDWLDAERGNLLAVQALAVAANTDTAVWQLAEALWALFTTRRHVADAIEAYRCGIAAAVRLGDHQAHAQIGKQLAAVYREVGDLERAALVLDQALAVLPDHGAERMTASVWEAVGKIRLLQEALPAAREAFERSHRINAEHGWERGRLLQEVMLGVVLRTEGELTASLDVLSAAAAGLARFDGRNQARVAVELAATSAALGAHERSLGHYQAAAGLYAERGERLGQISALRGALEQAQRLGRTDLVRAGLEQLAHVYAEAGDAAAAAQVAEQLARITGRE